MNPAQYKEQKVEEEEKVDMKEGLKDAEEKE
jgi:hypothetical protein